MNHTIFIPLRHVSAMCCVRLFVCLSVCILVTSRKTTDGIFVKIIPEVCQWTRKNWFHLEVIRLWIWIIGSRIFLKDSSTLWERAMFDSLAYISGKIAWIVMKISS